MKIKRLGVNIDHVATVRNARGEFYPSPLRAALLAQRSGADLVTIHLREDRRHIRDNDLKDLKKKLSIPINLEMAPTKQMLKIAIKFKPNFVCIVPEKRRELTTEGGLNVSKNRIPLYNIIKILKKKNIRVSLFIKPSIKDIKISYDLKANCVELHTGKFCKLFINKKNTTKVYSELKDSVNYARKIGLDVHVGHGLTYETAKKISKIRGISEFNIGHFIVSESIFIGLKKTIIKFNRIINN